MLGTDAHAEAVAVEGRRVADVAGRVPLDRPVPTCPEWSLGELVRHLGAVHRWATGYVDGRFGQRVDVDLDEAVGTWPGQDDLLAWFREGHRRLVAALAAADPGLDCWTFLPAPSPLAMWARRQCHETTIHRVDAEAAAGGPVTPVDPGVAADGIDELVRGFVTRRRSRLRSDPPTSLRIATSDTGHDWLLAIGPDRVVTTPGGDGPADATVRGPAGDLYLALWNRRGTGDLAVEGDPAVLALFRDRVTVRWS